MKRAQVDVTGPADAVHWHHRLLDSLGPREVAELEGVGPSGERAWLTSRLERLLQREAGLMSESERRRLVAAVIDEIYGWGPLEGLRRQGDVTDILVNPDGRVWVERAGRLEPVQQRFADRDHMQRFAERLAAAVERRVDESAPIVDGVLATGERFTVVEPPLVGDRPAIAIRLRAVVARLASLVDVGMLDQATADLLAWAARASATIVFSGGVGTGKTTLLRAVAAEVAPTERIVTVEESRELGLGEGEGLANVLALVARAPNVQGEGEVSQGTLVRASLRLRPDRFIVEEVRDGAVAEQVRQVINTGHSGTMTTVHANSPTEAILRLAQLTLSAHPGSPAALVKGELASGIDLVVQLTRVGTHRYVREVAAVEGLQGDEVHVTPLVTLRPGSSPPTWDRRRTPSGSRLVRRAAAVGVPLPMALAPEEEAG